MFKIIKNIFKLFIVFIFLNNEYNIICSSVLIALSNEDNFYSYMLKPITCTKKGIHDFIINIYNHDKYKDFFSSCLIHVLDLLESANKTNSPSMFAKQSLNLFIQKIYETKSINPHAFLYFLQQSHPHLSEIIKNEKLCIEKLISEKLKDLILEEQSLNLDNLKNFSEKCSKIITNSIENDYFSYIETQNIYSSFIENSLLKIFFDMRELDETLECFNQITNCLKYLYDSRIIASEENFHKLIWILSIQFSKSIQLQKDYLSKNSKDILLDFINNLSNEIFSEEIESIINTKKNFLLNTIISLKI